MCKVIQHFVLDLTDGVIGAQFSYCTLFSCFLPFIHWHLWLKRFGRLYAACNVSEASTAPHHLLFPPSSLLPYVVQGSFRFDP
jgi:hypothetical protein